MQGIHDAYDMTTHNRSGSAQAAVLTGDFAREYGIFGPPAYCTELPAASRRMGLTRLVIVGPSRDADPRRDGPCRGPLRGRGHAGGPSLDHLIR